MAEPGALGKRTTMTPEEFLQLRDALVTTPETEPRAVAAEIVAEFPEAERAEVARILTRIEILAQRRAGNTAKNADGAVTASEFIDVFYSDKPVPRIDDVMCVSRDTTETLIGGSPWREDFPEGEEGRLACISAYDEWRRRELLLGRVADAIQKRYGWSLEDGTAFSVGRDCYAVLIRPSARTETPPATSETAAEDWTDPETFAKVAEKHDAVIDALDALEGIAEAIDAGLLEESGENDPSSRAGDLRNRLDYFTLLVEDAKSAVRSHGNALDSREYVHALERVGALEKKLAAGEAAYEKFSGTEE